MATRRGGAGSLLFACWVLSTIIGSKAQDCYSITPAIPDFLTVVATSHNSSVSQMASTDCKELCFKIQFEFAAIEDAAFCYCGMDPTALTAGTSGCSVLCSDGVACGSEGEISTFELSTSSGFIDVIIEPSITSYPLADPVTITVNASDLYAVDWGDGSTPYTSASTHTYSLPGTYIISGFLSTLPAIRSSLSVVIHDVPAFELTCPTTLTLNIPENCSVESQVQGYDFQVSWNLTNSTYTDSYLANIPAQVIEVIGNDYNATETLTASTVALGTLVVMPDAKVKRDGVLVRIRANVPAGSGTIGIYAVTPSCSSGSYCGHTDACSASCPAPGTEISCATSFCSVFSVCKSDTCPAGGAPDANDYTYTLLTTVEVTAPEFDFYFPDTVYVPAGVELAFGCTTTDADCASVAVVNTRPLGVQEAADALLDTTGATATKSIGNTRHLVQFLVRGDPHINMNFSLLCEAVAPVPLADVPTPFDASTEEKVFEGDLTLTYNFLSPLMDTSASLKTEAILCQQEILQPELSEVEVWMKFGDPYSFTVTFSQGSPLFSQVDIDGTINYFYHDDGTMGYDLTYDLVYAQEGLYLMAGNTSNALGFVLYNVSVHVIPEVTDTWVLEFTCPCLDFEDGFPFLMSFPSAPNPPWNATFTAVYDSSNLFPEELIDFETFGNNGAAAPLTIPKTAVILQKGLYNVTVKLENRISSTTVSQTVLVEEAIRDVSALMFWNNSGLIMEGIGSEKNMFLANHTFFLYPQCRTGVPDKWRVIINETGEIIYTSTTAENFTYTFPQEDDLTLIVSGYNTVQGWVDSPPIPIKIVFKLQGFVLTDDKIVTKPGDTKNIFGEFLVFTPLSCVIIDYGDGSSAESFGYEPICSEKYPDLEYKGEVMAPVDMPHVYQEQGVYEVISIAFDKNGEFSQDLLVTIGDIPCTMPEVFIINGVKYLDSPTKFWMSLSPSMDGDAKFQCNVTVTTERWWEISKVDPETAIDIKSLTIKDVISTWNSPRLTLTPRFLDYGTYKLTYYLKVIPPDPTVYLQRKDFAYIEIIPTPLRPVLVTGSVSKLKVGFGYEVTLYPGTLSNDPDYPDEEITNMTLWCHQVAPTPESIPQNGEGYYVELNEHSIPTGVIADKTHSAEGCFGLGPGTITMNGPVIPFNSKFFMYQVGTFKFILEIRKDGRFSSTTLELEVVSEPPPLMNIHCAEEVCWPSVSSLVINPTKRLGLPGSCVQECGELAELKYAWTITSKIGLIVDESTDTCGDTSTSGGAVMNTEITDCQETFITPKDSKDLAIAPIFFSQNENIDEYVVRLTGSTNDDRLGFAEILIKVNKPPINGNCELGTSSGDALVSIYPVECQKWIDPESIGIESYTYFYYKDTSSGPLKTSITSTSKTALDLILPFGTFDLFVDITDRLSATTTFPLGTVSAEMPTQEEVEAYDASSVMKYLADIGDSATLSMVVVALSSIQNNADWLSLSAEDIANLTDEELQNRIVEIATLKQQQLSLISETGDYSTMEGLNLMAVAIQSVVADLYESEQASKTIDLASREIALSTIEEMIGSVRNVPVTSPQEFVPLLSNSMDAIGALIKGGNQILLSNDVPYTDMAIAGDLDYDGDVAFDYNMVATTDIDEMYKQNVYDTTKYKMRNQIKSVLGAMNQLYKEVEKISVVGESVISHSPNGASVVITKILEWSLNPGLLIDISTNMGSSVEFPKAFCPSRNVDPDTDCNKLITVVVAIWPCITHLYPDNSKVLASDIRVVDVIINLNGEAIPVKNETDPILIKIPRTIQSAPLFTHVNVTDEMNEVVPIVYHSFKIENDGGAFSIEIIPDKPVGSSRVIMLIDYQRMPTPSKHMTRVLIKDMNRSSDGVYRYVVGSKENDDKKGHFYIGIALLKNDFSYTPTYELTKDNFEDTFDLDYSIRVYVSGCYFFDYEDVEWKGRDVYAVEFTPSIVTCATSHLTQFGFGFTPSPNTLDFEYIFANAGFLDNLTVYLVLIIITCLYIIMMVWGHFMDRKDHERRGVIPLPDNDVNDKYLYEVSFQTGPDSEASTDSNIYFILSGEYGETAPRSLPPSNGCLYRRFCINSFVMSTSGPLGPLSYLRVFHDNKGEPPLDTWQLQMVIVRDLQKGEKYVFDTNSWLAFNRDEGKIDKIFMSYQGQDEKTFTQNMYIRSNRTVNQDNMWLSMFLRPVGSRFGRKERVSVCSAFLYLSMLVDGIWFDSSEEAKREGYLNIGPFSLSTETVITGLITIFFLYPAILILAEVFKRARPRKLKKCRAIESIQKQRYKQLKKQKNDSTVAEQQSKVEIIESKKKRPKDVSAVKCLPWWTRVIAWLFIIASIAISIFFIWSYAILWGEGKTVRWLSSFILSFLISIVITQWLKVILMSIFVSTVCKKDLTAEDIDCDEELPNLKQDEQWLHSKPMSQSIRKRVHKVEGVDMENPEIQKMSVRMMKDREISHVMRGILAYCIFLAIIYILAGSRTDYNGFILQTHLKQTFIKENHLIYDFSKLVRTTNDWWIWARNVILQELRVQRYYNNAPPYGGKGYLNDQENRIMGYAIIRQIRSKRHNCIVPGIMGDLIEHCSGSRGISNEDDTDFCANWRFNESFPGACRWREFKYMSADEVGTFSYTGRLGSYSGGGYVFRLAGRQNELIKRMHDLQKYSWIDGNTRAVILEFSVYNTNVNLFAICTIVAEFNEGGGILTKWRFEPIRLIKEDGITGFITTVCEIGFVAATIFFTLRELWNIKKLKFKYLDSYWNIAEICILLVSYAAIGIYIYKSILTQEALNVFSLTFGNGYVRMDSAAFLDEIYLYLSAIIVFFSTLKLIKLLQFNKKMDVLALTIRSCWDELKMFFLAFGIVFFAFACLFFFMFTQKIEEFAQILSAIQTSFKMMMGKFNFEEMNQANPISPLLFFVFSVTNSMILINIMLTIIIQAFNEVKMELEKKENRLNVIDYIWMSFRHFLRKENLPRIHVEPKFTDKVERNIGSLPKSNEGDHLDDKVGLLVKYINDVYFDGKLDMEDPRHKSLFDKAVPRKYPSFKDPKKSGYRAILSTDD